MNTDKAEIFADSLAERIMEMRRRSGADADGRITVLIDDKPFKILAGSTAAAAIAYATDDVGVTRRSLGGALRAPLCGTGVCQECRVTIDGRAHRLACQTLCVQGMHIDTARVAV
ncbi:MAG: ferredoxin [Herbaspirillum sp.]|jgi:predicted molibdopterin-dependent oxidoreductase YjgC|nr:ferredoxin [Herbaspirillum sp.]